ncbi:putative electron carrier/iron ion-binding protein [Senna tora]|uniref:Putative electron carrier/iron ion-binding protein n=1 Tax=Senna tora TaxID=362788 RepID=A0A834TY66_9FABA|nr:putative electron carrier/iron ion-binding protein [Senna tora]
MAAASPAINNNSNNAVMNAATAPSKPTTLAAAANLGNRTDTPLKSQRGHNKPKCKQCGNVARSRCPFESCKSCCSRNQNPCHIHVLKANSTLPDKSPSTGAAPLDHQQSTEPSLSSSASRVASLRQLSNSFAQFNNLHVTLRSRKPLTRKDAAAINEWRFSKLKEYKERNIEVENEAFDRYMQNVNLLEEVLSVKPMENYVSSALESNPTSTGNSEILIPRVKLQLRSNSTRSDNLRKRIKRIVDDGLKKLQECALEGDEEEPNNKASKRPKILRTQRLLAISDLIDKINKARNEEDLRSCLEMKAQVFNLDKGSSKIVTEDNEIHKEQTVKSDVAPGKEKGFSLPKLVGAAEIDQETLNIIDKHFCSLEHVGEL